MPPFCQTNNCSNPPLHGTFVTTQERRLTRRGVLWLGQTCNLRCYFCYFLDRIKAKDHPEHPFMSLAKAKSICDVLLNYYQNSSVDIQGGEPLIYKEIYELVHYCRTIGLPPTVITNALVLADKDRCRQLKEAGIRDVLVSVHGLGSVYDTIVGVPGAHQKQADALKNLQEIGIPVRLNCVLSKSVLPQLLDIAALARNNGVRIVNFIAFNPFGDQRKPGKRSSENVPRLSEISPYLTEALDLLDECGIECNVRYLPFCVVPQRHSKSIYNFQQLSYDSHEWDFASWAWTVMPQQRSRDSKLCRPFPLHSITYRNLQYDGILGSPVDMLKRTVERFPQLYQPLLELHRRLSIMAHGKPEDEDREKLYQEHAKMRASAHARYRFAESCRTCRVFAICDGVHGSYADLYGLTETTPILGTQSISNPKHFICQQQKLVEKEEYEPAI